MSRLAAILALESTQQGEATAGRVVAIAGRFEKPLRVARSGTVVHLMHGEQDRGLPGGLTVETERQFRVLGARTSLDRHPGLGRGADARVVETIVRRPDEADPKA